VGGLGGTRNGAGGNGITNETHQETKGSKETGSYRNTGKQKHWRAKYPNRNPVLVEKGRGNRILSLRRRGKKSVKGGAERRRTGHVGLRAERQAGGKSGRKGNRPQHLFKNVTETSW